MRAYDLVILGGALEGRLAAMAAVRTGARVALVEPPELFYLHQQQQYLCQGLQQFGQNAAGAVVNQLFQPGTPAVQSGVANQPFDWPALLAWSAIAADTQFNSLSPAAMNASGVDVILEPPQRLSRKLRVITPTRQLSTRAVLVAFGRSPTGLQPLMAVPELPHSVQICGSEPRAVQWALALAALGVRVTLQTEQLLSCWDEDIQRLVRSQLISAGIIFAKTSQSPAGQPASTAETDPPPQSKKRKKTNLILDLENEQPAFILPRFVTNAVTKVVTNFNDFPQKQQTCFSVNPKLQMNHPRVFACGSVLNRSNLNHSNSRAIALHEIDVAVHNALFWPSRQVNYRAIARSSTPMAPTGATTADFAQIGLSQQQAQQRYGQAITVQSASSPNSTDLSSAIPLPYYCKLICWRQRLVGICLFGRGASELIDPLATVLDQPAAALGSLACGYTVPGTLMDVVKIAASQTHQTQWQVGQWRRDWAENWFNWRRNAAR